VTASTGGRRRIVPPWPAEGLTRSNDIYKFKSMFVSVCCDLSSSDHEQGVAALLKQYGFAKVQADVFEHTAINDEYVKR